MTRIYMIDTISSSNDYCIVDDTGNLDEYELTKGLPWTQAPNDFRDAQMTIDEDEWGGLELTDLLGSTNSLLLMRGEVVADLRRELRLEPCETHRFRLMNARGRVHSDDYVIVNPLEPAPCLSMEKSDVQLSDDGNILGVDEFVLLRSKLPDRDLFRVAEETFTYFVTQRFVDYVRKKTCTNFQFEEIELV